MAKVTWATKFVFGCIPMRFLPTKSLRAKANAAMVKAIAWDSVLGVEIFEYHFNFTLIPDILFWNHKCASWFCFI